MKLDRRDGAQTAASAIKELIFAEGLRPGDPMPTEAHLVERLGISRSSVREAVRTLVALDILEVRHGTGTFVGKLSLRPLVEGMVFRGVLMAGDDFSVLREIIEVRRALDLSLGERIVERLRGCDDTELRSCVVSMKVSASRHESVAVQDRLFHLCLAEKLGSALYAELVTAFWDINKRISPRLGVAPQRDLDATAAAHERMLDAAVAGDLAGYQEAVLAHYDPILRMLDRRTAPAES